MAINYPVIFKFDNKGIKQATSSLKKFSKFATGVAAGATTAVAGIATAGIREFAKFDSALNQSISIMGDVSDSLRNDMAETAREVAKSTTFSAEQAAESFFFLASAGLDAEQSVAAMPQVAKFAQAGMFDMATATDLATDAQSALGLASDDSQENLANLTRVTDVFVKANTLANTSVEQLATAFTTKAGTALKTVGKDVESGAAALAVFADQGIKGERAGTLLTNTIFGLTDRVGAVPEKFDKLGVSVFDAEGNMRDFASIADDFGSALGSMSTEQQVATLRQLGFTKQSREGLLALQGQGDALREYETALREAGGTADEVANNQLQTAAAQFELLKSNIQDAGITIGAALTPVILTLVDSLVPLIEQAMPSITAAFEGLIPVIEMVIGFLPDIINLFTGLFPILVSIVEIVFNLAQMALPALMSIFTSLTPIVMQILPLFETFLTQLLEPLIPVILQTIEAFIPLIEQVLPILNELMIALLPLVTELLTDIPIILQIIQAFLPLLSAVLPVLIAILKDGVIPIIKTLAGTFTEVLAHAIDFITTHITTFTGFVEVAAGMFLEAWQAIVTPFKNIFNGILGTFEGFVNFIIDGVNSVIRAIRSIRVTIPAFPPFFGGATIAAPYIPEVSRINIPRLAEGGIVMPQPGGVFANLAEAGQPEAVIPLDRMGDMGSTYNINVNAGVGTDPVSVGRAVVDAIKRYESTSGKVFASA